MLDTIIFDMDGVIVDSEPAWRKADTLLLKSHSAVFDDELFDSLLGKSMIESTKIMMEWFDVKDDAREWAEERVSLVKNEYEKVKFIPGFEKFYSRVKGKYKTCVATSSPPEIVDVVCRTLGLFKLFDGNVFTASEVGNASKPDPALFLYAAKKVKSTPSSCVVIEDAPNGVMAARNAKMKCVAITTSVSREKLAGADLIVDSFREINLNKLSD